MVSPRQVGSVMAAVGFALFAFLIYLVKQKQQGACNSSFFSAKSAEVCNATYRVQVDGKNKRREKIVLSKELTDKATGIKIPRHQKFGKSQLTCLGVGVRAKSIAIAKVNVYSVALYVEDKPARHALKKFRGEDPRTLSNDDSVFYALGAHNSFGGGFKKYLHLVFARPVGATKIVDALTSVKDVDEDVLARFSSITLEAIGNSIHKGETLSLGWEGKDKMVVMVRDRLAGTVTDPHLPKAVFDLYLGSNPVSPVAKAAFAEGVPDFLDS